MEQNCDILKSSLSSYCMRSASLYCHGQNLNALYVSRMVGFKHGWIKTSMSCGFSGKKEENVSEHISLTHEHFTVTACHILSKMCVWLCEVWAMSKI